jgi:isopenicillin-N epimerase
MEAEPVRFFVTEYPALLDAARAELAAFVKARPEDLVFVPNATHGVNTVLGSVRFEAGDEILTTDHAYHACQNALARVALRSGARVLTANVPFPLSGPAEVEEAILRATGPRTKLVLLDHVTSPTGMVWPIERIVPELAARGIDALVDGAHGPGMVPLDLGALGAAYYTANCHKWLCAPKGAAFLHVRRDRQASIAPLATSHGYDSNRTDRSLFQIELDWCGTDDPTPYLSVPAAIRALGAMLPGGWAALMEHNRSLALAARRCLLDALSVAPPCPDSMIGALAAVPLPDARPGEEPAGPFYQDPLKERLLTERGIEVPIVPWPAPPRRLIRISAQIYNQLSEYEALADALRTHFGASG